ncbi:MAG TPA: metalloregulator ArsR/SmtB family transcription factor [Candidatus Limnocylindria bacterium]|jgi:DNA-binding transcriptional ArsR family regulator
MDAAERPIDARAVAVAEQAMLGREGERAARDILSSLCDPTRLKIVRALNQTPLAASDLARVIKRSRAATSQHLKVLRDVDAVVPARQGNIVRYRLSSNVSAQVLADVGRAFERLAGSEAASG